LLARDIFESRDTELRLKESKLQYLTLADSGQALIWTAGTDKQCDYFNKIWLDFTGRTLEQELGNGWTEGVHPDDLPYCMDEYTSAFDQRKKFSMDYRLRHHDGEYRWIQDDGCPRYNSTGEFIGYIGYCLDITGRKLAEQQLRELSAHLQTVREEEKSSVAREIHDDLGGTLTALKMDTYWLMRKLAAEKEMASLLERVESMSGLVDNAVSVTRRVITELRPTILDDLGLLAALEWQCGQFQKRTGIECRVACGGDEGCDEKLDGIVSINLFRIFQESLTNVVRHSGASRVEVELRRDDKEVTMLIRDNGRGLPQGQTVASTSYGLRGMRERAEQLGGKIKFDTQPGGGMSVGVSLPLPPAKNIEEKT
jgi:PAS domain S-box-containing protein